MVTKESTEYEKTMPLPPMPGSIEFIRMLKEHGVQIGLVTSSDNAKVKRAFGLLHLDNLFDTLVTADRITQGKPDPMCYLQFRESHVRGLFEMVSNREKGNDYFLHSFTYPFTHTHTHVCVH